MVQIRGITWDHVRGFSPLKAAAAEYNQYYSTITISWDIRSLKDFEDYPIEKLAEKYDLILLDHPFIGTGVKKGVLVPLDDWVSKEFLIDQKNNSVGPSYDSYTWDGRQWALAVDAAAQVSAYRSDLMNRLSLNVPKSWSEVFELADELSDQAKIAIPLHPTHAYSSFISLCANVGGFDFWSKTDGINIEVGKESLGLLQKLLPIVHEGSMEMNPIQMSNFMSQRDEILYVPLIFGYSNYARSGFADHVLHFTNIPSTHSKPAGSLLGGVGMAISAFSKHKREAVEFAKYVSAGDFQRGLYFDSGGQPGHRTAWTDPEVNQKSNSFFENTLETLDHAYTRPRDYGYNHFQEQAGKIIHQGLKNGYDHAEVIQNLNSLYCKCIEI